MTLLGGAVFGDLPLAVLAFNNFFTGTYKILSPLLGAAEGCFAQDCIEPFGEVWPGIGLTIIHFQGPAR